MNSIIDNNYKERCYSCGKYCQTECHHIFGGRNRKKSDYYGLTVYLCHDCHNEPPNGMHYNKAHRGWLQHIGQKEAMEYYGWSVDDFRAKFGKNYL